MSRTRSQGESHGPWASWLLRKADKHSGARAWNLGDSMLDGDSLWYIAFVRMEQGECDG